MSGSEMKALAKRQMKGQWVSAIVIVLLSGLIMGAIGLIGSVLGPFSFLLTMVVNGPITLGTAMFFMHVVRGERAEIGDMFNGFKRFSGAFVLIFLQGLFTMLWSLLLIIPGIIKGYAYSMSFYILADHPEYSASEALKESQRMMKGHKMELFCLQLSFIGWAILGIITLGLGELYTIPYMKTATAAFYENLSGGTISSRAEGPKTPEVSGEDYRQASIPGQNSQEISRDTEVLGIGSTPTTVLKQNPLEGSFTGVKGSLSGVAYALDDNVEYSVGRDEDFCGITVDPDNTSVSRMHCTIQFVSAQNGYYVTDQSSNGTFADGVRLLKGEPQFVQRGTVITLGDQSEGFSLD